jgi:hypothetical protein
LIWNEFPESTYTFTGKPANLAGLDRRLSGETIIHSNNRLYFPSGIQGNLNFQGETLTLRADNAEIIGDDVNSEFFNTSIKELRLKGRVECSAQAYRFSSKETQISLKNNRIERIIAFGGTRLHGSLGSGMGDTLELVFQPGENQPVVSWTGKVRGKVEVPFEQ